MKVAMWALGMLVLSLFGVVLVNLFGNITITDQLNYTTMKNTVEASMYDALDKGYFRTGFCLCTNVEKTGTQWVFTDDSSYELSDIKYDDNHKAYCESPTKMKNCEALYGEYRIDSKTFSESLVRRFAEMVNNSKNYEIVIQDIIEYPPKVSVRVISKDKEYSPTDKESGGYDITNQIDAIIETEKAKLAETPKDTKADEDNPWEGWTTGIDDLPSTSSPLCYYPTKADCEIQEGVCKQNSDGCWLGEMGKPACANYEYGCSEESSTSSTSTTTNSVGYTSNSSNCKWHAHMTSANVTVYLAGYSSSNQSTTCNHATSNKFSSESAAVSGGKQELLNYAKKNCVDEPKRTWNNHAKKTKDTGYNVTGVSVNSISLEGHQTYNVYEYGTTNVLCTVHTGGGPTAAIGRCFKCRDKNCVARCTN